MARLWHTLLVAALVSSGRVAAIGQERCVSFSSSNDSDFTIASGGTAATILLSADEWPGVQRAASDFSADIFAVTGAQPALANATSSAKNVSADSVIIVGTLGKSSLIDAVVNNTGLNVSGIDGQWEAFMSAVVENPLPGVSKAYVIVGADKRGTIFALYDHSEQFGVSPWYWWADVPTTEHDALHVAASGCSHGSPTVKYRGIFLNDEQPALQNWAQEKFTNGTGAALTGSPFNHRFYTKLYELLLRLKANFLWPAQWSSAFGIDDELNQFYADEYGIVMGTSHEEPMMRSIPVEWNLFGNGTAWDYSTNKEAIYPFWVEGAERSRLYESLYTVGMRGNGDLPGANTNIQLLEEIVADQRTIMSNVYNISDVTTIPQAWCLYKEVQGYFEEGLEVPDDVTLLWTDDNWGNIRRFPIPSERNRTGGAGVYYHFDYVGDPRNYKWIQSTQLSKVFEQMSLAVDREATRIWVVNVGDMKPLEMDIDFFLTYGYDSSLWTPTNIDSFVHEWAVREFDLSNEKATEVVGIVGNMTRYLARVKPELLSATTFSTFNYREAETVLAQWQALNASSTKIYNSLSDAMKPAFFQLVHHPVQAGATLTAMWISAGINNLRSLQGRLSANDYAEKTLDFFEHDYDIELEYHTMLDGKWDQMMSQTHTYYYYWQEPSQNTMPFVSRVSSRKENIVGPMRVLLENSNGSWPGDEQYNCALGYSCPTPTLTLDRFSSFGSRYIDIGLGGPTPFKFSASANVSWLNFSSTGGSLDPSNPEKRIFLTVNWDAVEGAQTAEIVFNATANGFVKKSSVPILFVANHTTVPDNFTGFVEGDGAIAIEAAHASRNTSVGEVSWIEIPNYGRTLSGVTPWPRLGNNEQNYTAGSGPSLEYDFANFNTIDGNGTVGVTVFVSPSLNANGDDRPLGIGVQVDDDEPQTTYFIPFAAPGQEPAVWNDFVANSIVPVVGNFTAWPGAHTLKLWMIEPTVVVQKVVIDCGGLLDSFLGPPESVLVQ
ncbi:glycoside hydrolase family 115 protein [Peniophora sp. CONT]|nr:glycoside hydrolase family 115 protein [Peniophora sp. CONT]